jgi:glyoxylase-like metal-dependent hydrolase (beta-lactamase superfamily II)
MIPIAEVSAFADGEQIDVPGRPRAVHASLDALRGIDADLLLPGHGDPWTRGMAEAVQKARAAGPS